MRPPDPDDLATVESADDLAIKRANVERRPGWVCDHASLGGCDWRGERKPRHNKLGKHRPAKHLPNRSSGRVIGCLLQTEFWRLRHFRLELRPPRY
jgi:hypothetical protein